MSDSHARGTFRPERLRKTIAPGRGIGEREGDFAEFYRAEVHRLVRFVMKIGATEHEAADAAQAAFTLAWESWASIHSNRRAWIRTVATREFYRSAPKREFSTAAIPDRPALLSPEMTVEVSERTKLVHDLLMSLPAKQRIVMAWRADGFSPAEIARGTGCMTDAAVRKNLQRARAALKALLAERQELGDS